MNKCEVVWPISSAGSSLCLHAGSSLSPSKPEERKLSERKFSPSTRIGGASFYWESGDRLLVRAKRSDSVTRAETSQRSLDRSHYISIRQRLNYSCNQPTPRHMRACKNACRATQKTKTAPGRTRPRIYSSRPLTRACIYKFMSTVCLCMCGMAGWGLARVRHGRCRQQIGSPTSTTLSTTAAQTLRRRGRGVALESR